MGESFPGKIQEAALDPQTKPINHIPASLEARYPMVSLPLAKKLKKIGIPWDPKANDYFAIPDRGFDERVFVISEMMTNIEQIHGRSVVTFHGGAEWAMDYLVTSEIVWLPRESQMRALLHEKIKESQERDPVDRHLSGTLLLQSNGAKCTCSLVIGGTTYHHEAAQAADAYALAYIHLSKFAENAPGGLN